eukprot:6197835-Pleurochrysis_carterae.AAC.3
MRYLVVDAAPIIRGAQLHALGAEKLVTVPEVLREVRDYAARARLAAMPVEIEVKEPSEEAMKAGALLLMASGQPETMS